MTSKTASFSGIPDCSPGESHSGDPPVCTLIVEAADETTEEEVDPQLMIAGFENSLQEQAAHGCRDVDARTYSAYSNPTIDKILQKARETEDKDEKLKLYKQFQVESNIHFRYYDLRNATAITIFGQVGIQWIARIKNCCNSGIFFAKSSVFSENVL